MKKPLWRKIALCCYPIYLIFGVIRTPIVAVVLLYEEGYFDEFSYSAYKQYKQ